MFCDLAPVLEMLPVCPWIVLLSCFLHMEFGERASLHFVLSVPILVRAGSGYVCGPHILMNLESVPCVFQGFTPLDQRLIHRSLPDNATSYLGFYLDGWGNPWVTCLISSKSHMLTWILCPFDPSKELVKGFPVTPLAISPEYSFLAMNLLILVSLQSG